MKSALAQTRKLGKWGLGALGSGIGLAIAAWLLRHRFDVDTLYGTIVLVVGVFVGGYLVSLALATGHLERDRDRWRRDWNVVNGWVNATRTIRAHLSGDYDSRTEDRVRLFAENIVSAIMLTSPYSQERVREVEAIAEDATIAPGKHLQRLKQLLRTRLEEDAYLRPG